MSSKSNHKRVKRKIIIESFIVFFIAISPFLFKVYDYFPEDPEATISLFGYEIGNGGFHSVSVYFWFLLGKIIPLYLFIFWFFTSKNWWYHILIIPIALYAFQLFEVIFDSDDKIDTENIWWLLPVCMVVLPFVYLIRIKLYDKYVNGIDLEAMEAELHSLKQKRLKQQNMEANKDKEELPKAELPKVDYRSLSEWIDQEFSTAKLAQRLRNFQSSLKNLFL